MRQPVVAGVVNVGDRRPALVAGADQHHVSVAIGAGEDLAVGVEAVRSLRSLVHQDDLLPFHGERVEHSRRAPRMMAITRPDT